MNFEEIGKRIRKRRIELGLTQEELAEKVDVSITYIGAIERFTSKCSIETLASISEILDLNMDYLLFGVTPKNCDSTFSKIMDTLPQSNKQLFVNLCVFYFYYSFYYFRYFYIYIFSL